MPCRPHTRYTKYSSNDVREPTAGSEREGQSSLRRGTRAMKSMDTQFREADRQTDRRWDDTYYRGAEMVRGTCHRGRYTLHPLMANASVH